MFQKGQRGPNAGKGRPVGSKNKITFDIKALAKSYGNAAITRLAELAGFIPDKPAAKKEETQVAAIRELLDRGFGKPKQALTLDGEDGAVLGLIVIPGKSVADYGLARQAAATAVELPPQPLMIEGATAEAE
jgi:hypothetical protein